MLEIYYKKDDVLNYLNDKREEYNATAHAIYFIIIDLENDEIKEHIIEVIEEPIIEHQK